MEKHNRPVVLLHGFLGWGFAQAAKLRIDYFHRIAERLRVEHGLRVLVPRVASSGQRTVRGSQLLEALRTWPERSPGERAVVIGHSQGGLDARWAASQQEGMELISQVITLSTPHHGTALCDKVAVPLIESETMRD